ncbi:MAG: SDR family oxidoreductase [Actinomycetales bacterium]
MTPTYDFHDRVALVTGAGNGMGAAAAEAFVRAGAAVALLDNDSAAMAALEQRLRHAGGEAMGIACDVTDETQVAAAIGTVVGRWGRLDAAFNNAGIMPPSAGAAEETADAFDRVVAVNLRGVWACMKHELAAMQNTGGAIVNCSSLGGLVGGPGRSAYHGTKHGVIGLTKSAALEYGPRGVRVNAVCPGTIDTPMVERMAAARELDLTQAIAAIAMGRLGTGDEIAQAVLWLCSQGASYVTGVALPVDGGYTAA